MRTTRHSRPEQLRQRWLHFLYKKIATSYAALVNPRFNLLTNGQSNYFDRHLSPHAQEGHSFVNQKVNPSASPPTLHMQTRPLPRFICFFWWILFASSTVNWSVAQVPFVTAQTLAGLKLNNASDNRGFKFTNTSGTSVTITHLGRWVLPGNNQPHTLSIFDTSPIPVQVAQVVVNCAGATPGQFLYGALPIPYVLQAGAQCYFMSSEIAGGDEWYGNNGTNLAFTNIGSIVSARIDGSAFDGNDQTRSFGPVSFKYSAPLPNWTKTGKIYTTDGSQYSVNSAITDASPGDTVTIPSGTFTWGALGAWVWIDKAITLAGAGKNQTTINIAPNAGTYASGAIGVVAAATIRGFTINQSGAAATTAFVASTNDGWRITDIIYNSALTAGYFVIASSYGLIDNCTVNTIAGSDEPIFVRGPTNSWQTPSGLGTSSAVFVESCIFNGPGYPDFNSNARGVFRFCTLNGTAKIDGHGLASNVPARGVRHMEVYGNRWTSTVNFWTAIELRGGTSMIFDNTSDATSTSSAWFYLTDYGYLSTWPNFGNVFQTPTNYPIKDQIGVGMDPKTAGSEPAYIWNNLKNGVSWARELKIVAPGAITLHGSPFTERDMIKADRDFFADSGFDGTFTFNGSAGVGRGTKAQMLAITPTKTGVGFWVTNEGSWNVNLPANTSGQLYTWTGTAWNLKYTPYTYPHPLRIPSAPSNLRTNP